jgi:hypothetical protein
MWGRQSPKSLGRKGFHVQRMIRSLVWLKDESNSIKDIQKLPEKLMR